MNEELQIIQRRLRKLRRTQPAAEIKAAESTEVENDCRTLGGYSTSLFNTVSILLCRLFTAEGIVSGKASKSKTVVKPKFDGDKLELLKKLAMEM